jgi:hypothetical protein
MKKVAIVKCHVHVNTPRMSPRPGLYSSICYTQYPSTTLFITTSNMSSLRRPSQFISAGRGPQPLTKEVVPAIPNEPERRKDARKSKVGDAIKRRMSMRYIQLLL